ncbi:trypsin-like serine protease, partial [Pseudomonas sp. GP01-A4]|uniref:trypsin-like serine protease n=1 Tax=Pseudomonas sp. GP01-A4 TaxID=2070571 RepID=UPI000CB1BAFE
PKGFVRLAGFGATDTEGRRGMSRLHFVDVPTRGWNCDREAEARTGCQPDFEMVIPRDRGNDTCAGDSGGPVLESFGAGLRVV